MVRQLTALIFAFCCMVFSAGATERPVLKICTENDDSYPWVLKDRPGLTISLLKLVEKEAGGKFEITPLPWKRCLEEVKSGAMNAVFKISYSAERLAELGAYPMAADKPDASKRLLMDSYSLYKIKGSKVEWDGKTLKADGTVGAQSGFSVVAQLKSLGAKVDDGSRSADANLRKLVEGRLVALALQTEEGDISVEGNPEFKLKVEKIKPFLIEKPYFLIFSKQFFATNPDYAQVVWAAIASSRESAEYKNLVKAFK